MSRRIKFLEMKYLLSLFFSLFLIMGIQAQQYLPGLWTGTLTENEKEYKVEIFIIKNRRNLSGRSYIYLSDQEVVQGELKGRLHDDLSMNLYDMKIVSPEEVIDSLHFPRHFQLIYHRSFNDMELRGHWQDWHHRASDPKRKQGRIVLERKASKA